MKTFLTLAFLALSGFFITAQTDEAKSVELFMKFSDCLLKDVTLSDDSPFTRMKAVSERINDKTKVIACLPKDIENKEEEANKIIKGFQDLFQRLPELRDPH